MRHNCKWKEIHHIIPVSRDRKKRKEINNMVIIDRIAHQNYHNLFWNKTPEEIIEYLNKIFWNNNYDIKIQEVI